MSKTPNDQREGEYSSNELFIERGNLYLRGADIDAVGSLAANACSSPPRTATEITVPSDWLSKREQRDGRYFHISLLTKNETRQAADNIASTDNTSPDLKNSKKNDTLHSFCRSFIGDRVQRGKDWFVIGVGSGEDESDTSSSRNNFRDRCVFLVVVYPCAAIMRKKLGLPPKDFHITIGFKENDVHTCHKGIGSLLLWQQPQSLSNAISSPQDLVNVARENILGGRPSTFVPTNQSPSVAKGNYRRASIILQTAEALFSKQFLSGGAIADEELDVFSILDIDHLRLACDLQQLRCQILGREGDFKNVLGRANSLLLLQKIHEGKLSDQERNSNEWGASIRCSALGYKGFSLVNMKYWSQAHQPLMDSHSELQVIKRRAISKDFGIGERVTYLGRQRNEEAIAVERMLAFCCQKLGYEPPLPTLVSFPRTAHLFNSGGTAVSSDDLVVGDSALLRMIGDGKTRVVVEEKIDGANMAFSLTADGEVVAQNRSHYISSGDHQQFGPLSAWVEEHRSSLVKVLTSVPDHHTRVASQGLVLYGEWCVAKHSIPYHKLPGYFVAFDLYDKLHDKFYARHRFHSILQDTRIPCAPVITVRSFGPYPDNVFRKGQNECSPRKENAFESDLRNLLNRESLFRTDGGYVEGVVLRVEDENSEWLIHRTKIVRPDFVRGCQDGHWSRRDIDKQSVDRIFADEYLSTQSYTLAPMLNQMQHDQSTHETSVAYKDGELFSNQESINPRRRLIVSMRDEDVVLPRNFSFLWPSEVAISSTPKNASQISAMKAVFNISLIITLTEEQPLPKRWFEDVEGCENMFVSVPNYYPPSMKQMDDVINTIERTVLGGGTVMVHCGGGKGRAGTVAACLLLRFGNSGIRASSSGQEEKIGSDMSSKFAVDAIRNSRPGSVETEKQEKFIRSYADELWNQPAEIYTTETLIQQQQHEPISSPSPGPSTPECSTQAEKPIASETKSVVVQKMTKAELKAERERAAAKARAQRRAPRCLILMGLPGSGKSTFSSLLASSSIPQSNTNGRKQTTKNNFDWIVINQDKMGRKECEKLAGKYGKGRIILDRCNPTESDRVKWLQIMHSPPKGDVALIYFAANAETCIHRVQNRESHETIPNGRGKRIVADMSKKFEPPTDAEKKRFGSVHIIETFEDATNLLHRFGF